MSKTLGPTSPHLAACLATALGLLAGGPRFGEAQTRTDRFELLSEPKVSLVHFLIDWAAADAEEWPIYAPPIAERRTWRILLGDQEAEVWSAALAAFAAAGGRSRVFDEGLIALRDYAAGGPLEDVRPGDRAMIDALESALPVYRAHWWPAHELRNRAWIADIAAVLDSLEEATIPRMAAAYGGTWPSGRITVDVVPYANDVGAYSTDGRVTVGSADPALVMPLALETVLHEASHVAPLERPLRRAIEEAFRRAGGEAPERLWHDLIFYTAGEVTRIALEERGLPGYVHYGEATGVYRRGERWRAELPAFEAHWRPFLRSGRRDEASRRAALEAVARSLMGPAPGAERGGASPPPRARRSPFTP